MYAGRVMNEWIPVVHASEQQMMLLQADDKHRRVKLNTEEPYLDEKTQKMEHHVIDDGAHTVTVSSGPSYDSQRKEVSSFVDTLIQNLKGLPIAPPVAAKILAIAIQMKELGPKGDQLAELISPPDQGGQMPPEAQAAIQHAQSMMQELQGELQKLLQEKQGKVVENEYRLKIEQLKSDTDIALKRLQIEADIAKAEISTKAQSIEERMKFVEDAWAQLHGQAHETAMQADAQQHAQQQQEGQQQAASEAQASDQQHAADQQDSAQQAAAEQQQAAAEQQPEPQAA
jgi:hypothetical protein